eukprot:3678905-Amphidinium_carterae.1
MVDALDVSRQAKTHTKGRHPQKVFLDLLRSFLGVVFGFLSFASCNTTCPLEVFLCFDQPQDHPNEVPKARSECFVES